MSLGKLGNVVVGQLKAPKGGVFNGRNIPKARINDLSWLQVLEAPPPPSDGPYVSRSSVVPAAPAPNQKKGLLYRIALAMVEYEQAQKKVVPTMPLTASPIVPAESGTRQVQGKRIEPPDTPQNKLIQQLDKRIDDPPVVDDWTTLSPDIETEYLGLEDLKPNDKLVIVGAGITGLTLAWLLRRSRPDVQITIIECNHEVGGYMKSLVQPNGYVFETGPRTLLPSHPGTVVLERMLTQIGARDAVMFGVPRTASSNQKALVNRGRIVKLPSSWTSTFSFLASTPLLSGGGRRGVLRDLWRRARNPRINDESVHSFISRRLGSVVADRLVSAVMRGIYAADSSRLSARSVARLNKLYYLERTEQMSVLAAAVSGSLGYLDSYAKHVLPLAYNSLVHRSFPTSDKKQKMVETSPFSLYGFKSGIQGMAQAIADDLEGVDIQLGVEATEIERKSSREVTVHTSEGTSKGSIDANVVVSTVSAPQLFETAPELATNVRGMNYSSLAVVNVYSPSATAPDGFGVLVPKSEDEWNVDGVLGVIYDSSVRNAMQHLTSQENEKQENEKGTKEESGASYTVMLGGDLWDSSVTEAEWKQRALNVLQKLELLLSTADVETRVTLQRNAIPLYEVGHSERQQRVHGELAHAYGNRVALAGMAFGRGCGVSDCVVDALTLALRFSPQRQLLYPSFFFNHWWSVTHPSYYA